MNAKDYFHICPAVLTQGDAGSLVSWNLDTRFAARPERDTADNYRLLPIAQADADCCPVYRQQPETAAAVATGKLFLRLYEDLSIEVFLETLAEHSLQISDRLKWAPHAVWLHAPEAGLCHTLNSLEALQSYPQVAHVEAQLALQLQRR